MAWLKNIGPGTLVAAAFIGPGTVTICTIAGVKHSYELLWAMVLSIIATIVLQELSARIGLVTQKGLAENIRLQINNKALRVLSLILIMSAIVIGNAAYEAGNISGGVLGLSTFTEWTIGGWNLYPIILGSIAFGLLFRGNYKIMERALIACVLLMSVSFMLGAILTKPNVLELFKGIFIPRFPHDSIWTIIGIIGTTVVPYNLFLHASLVNEKWDGISDLPAVRKDLYLSVIVGGLVSMSIIIAAAAVEDSNITNGADLALSLEPVYGSMSKYLLGIGLFAAGISSAITAPLAAAYVAKGCFDWEDNLKSWKFRAVWLCILLLGIGFSLTSYKPIEIIKFAQVANGLVLPFIAGFLIWLVNKRSVLGSHTNSLWMNILSFIILLASIGLGLRGLDKVFHFF